LKMRWKAELPKMPRLPRVPIDAQSARAEGSGAPATLGPPPSPSAYREKNPSEPPPGDYKAPSMLAEHRGLALLFLAAIIAFALYCWKAPHRAVALDAPAQTAGAAGGEAARTRSPETSQSPIYVEPLPDKER
jgi:hypothetical protein